MTSMGVGLPVNEMVVLLELRQVKVMLYNTELLAIETPVTSGSNHEVEIFPWLRAIDVPTLEAVNPLSGLGEGTLTELNCSTEVLQFIEY